MAYNRPHTLQRLLNSLAEATHPAEVPLIISIDRSDSDEVLQVAERFDWQPGSKEIIAHDTNLGLKRHALACGDLTERYEYVIFLEDDLLVAPAYYSFAQQAIARYADETAIAGVSLYTFGYYEQAAIPFVPLIDDRDVYFLQYPASWGSVLFRRSWQQFRHWLDQGQQILPTDRLPVGVKKYWSDQSWVKYYLKYLVTHGLYYLYPRTSFSTTFSDAGAHHREANTKYQVAMQLAADVAPRWVDFDDSFCVYDAFFELLPDRLNRLTSALVAYDYIVDLNATKEPHLYTEEYVLTTRPVQHSIASYAYQLRPAAMNVIRQLPGDAIRLARTEEVASTEISANVLHYYEHLTVSQLKYLVRRKLAKRLQKLLRR